VADAYSIIEPIPHSHKTSIELALAQAIRIRAGAHAFEAKVFNLVASSCVDSAKESCGHRTNWPLTNWQPYRSGIRALILTPNTGVSDARTKVAHTPLRRSATKYQTKELGRPLVCATWFGTWRTSTGCTPTEMGRHHRPRQPRPLRPHRGGRVPAPAGGVGHPAGTPAGALQLLWSGRGVRGRSHPSTCGGRDRGEYPRRGLSRWR
jgi:hypothetical protein